MRIDYADVAPEPIEHLRDLDRYLTGSGLGRPLLELVRLRASQLNGCAYCIDLHSRNLRSLGESERRIWALQAWRETNLFSEREKAALWWAEAVTEVGQSLVPDEVFRRARDSFSARELVDLTWAIAAINAWNRLSVAFRREVEGRAGRMGPPPRIAGAGSSHPQAGLTSTTEDQEIMH